MIGSPGDRRAAILLILRKTRVHREAKILSLHPSFSSTPFFFSADDSRASPPRPAPPRSSPARAAAQLPRPGCRAGAAVEPRTFGPVAADTRASAAAAQLPGPPPTRAPLRLPGPPLPHGSPARSPPMRAFPGPAAMGAGGRRPWDWTRRWSASSCVSAETRPPSSTACCAPPPLVAALEPLLAVHGPAPDS